MGLNTGPNVSQVVFNSTFTISCFQNSVDTLDPSVIRVDSTRPRCPLRYSELKLMVEERKPFVGSFQPREIGAHISLVKGHAVV